MTAMDRDIALTLLRGGRDGIREWNRLISEGASLPDLSRAFLINADLQGADLRGATLVGASFHQADLAMTNLAGGLLMEADFRGADLRGTLLRHANFAGAVFGNTLFACDLSEAIGLDSANHSSRSFIDVHTLRMLPAKFPEAFLRGCGLAEADIIHFRQEQERPLQQASCFICHCATEELLAARLLRDMQAAGVRCWKWAYETRIYEELLDPTNPVLGPTDKTVVILSRRSLTSELANREIGQLVEAECRRLDAAISSDQARLSEILIFIRVDDFVFEQGPAGRPLWEHPYRILVTDKAIIDAVGWETTAGKYAQVRDALIRAVKRASIT